MKTKFKNHYAPRVRHQQKYDRKKIFITQAGNTFNVYDRIQENAVDTDIYKTLEKYGTIENMKKYDHEAVQTEFDEYMSLMDLKEKQKKANNMWNALPAGVREVFKNDKYNFLQNGQEWLNKQIQATQQVKKEEQGGITNDDGAR